MSIICYSKLYRKFYDIQLTKMGLVYLTPMGPRGESLQESFHLQVPEKHFELINENKRLFNKQILLT